MGIEPCMYIPNSGSTLWYAHLFQSVHVFLELLGVREGDGIHALESLSLHIRTPVGTRDSGDTNCLRKPSIHNTGVGGREGEMLYRTSASACPPVEVYNTSLALWIHLVWVEIGFQPGFAKTVHGCARIMHMPYKVFKQLSDTVRTNLSFHTSCKTKHLQQSAVLHVSKPTLKMTTFLPEFLMQNTQHHRLVTPILHIQSL